MGTFVTAAAYLTNTCSLRTRTEGSLGHRGGGCTLQVEAVGEQWLRGGGVGQGSLQLSCFGDSLALLSAEPSGVMTMTSSLGGGSEGGGDRAQLTQNRPHQWPFLFLVSNPPSMREGPSVKAVGTRGPHCRPSSPTPTSGLTDFLHLSACCAGLWRGGCWLPG